MWSLGVPPSKKRKEIRGAREKTKELIDKVYHGQELKNIANRPPAKNESKNVSSKDLNNVYNVLSFNPFIA